MKLKDFFQNIALGELSGSPLVELGGYTLDSVQLPRVIQSLNQALEYMYSNFPLRQNQVLIQLQTGITMYYLDSLYARTNSNSPIAYICDTVENPFQDDVLHILSVQSSNGYEYPLNDSYSWNNVSTPEYNCIQLNGHFQDPYLLVKYQANHPVIPLSETLDSNYQIQISSSYRTALQTYVACLVYQNMGGNHLNESNALFAKFKTLIEELKLQGIGTITQTGNNIKPMLRNWI